jgi:hypothetical protein
MFEELANLKGKMYPFVLNVRNLIEWPEPLQSSPSALHVPTTVAPYSAAAAKMTLAISRL